MQENTCRCSCFGLFWRKRFGIIHAQVPFLATQARIRYRQFLYIAGTGITDAQARITFGAKMKENTCCCSCFGLFWRKRFRTIHAQVPFLATQARIMHRQFLYIAGTGITDAQARIMLERKCKKIHVAVLVSVYSGQKDLE